MPHGNTSVHDELRQAGLRVTGPRVAVLEWLEGHPHATADQVGTGVRERLGSVSTQAIYDVLVACSTAGLVRRIEPAGHPARYERRVGDNHHHLVCRECGRIDDVDCAVGDQPCLVPSEAHGYDVDEAEVVFWGICRDCSRAAASAAATGTTTDTASRTTDGASGTGPRTDPDMAPLTHDPANDEEAQ
ncbi:transcriptional repressor [Actinobacteria bacterium YIM 96077]|uniref:Transcriptional repressor n=1 Tax=Phytoactinopolyspora halophila TaxID=1981511 RepID=A0A329QCD5_9ACTN|nr:Fur family transcriptional regulator [Phytoactinopolyspora halophila]AYY13970.1 transcriptional repressor [Actinobacteria bacterium YIM 96077]RAW09409.1 transcriptional repressor [Phytoactinopolyspora halophila]